MPESKTKTTSTATKNQQGDEDKPIKINKWDTNAAKNALDDGVRKLITDRYGFTERTYYIDLRLFMATIAVGFALFALLWDWLYPFPKSRPVLIICVLAYFTLMGVLQLYTMFIEKGTFYVAVDEDPTGNVGDVYWSFSSTLKRFDDIYTLQIQFHSADKRTRGEASITKSISAWFDDEGSLMTDSFAADVYKLQESLSTGKKDK